MKTYVVGNWKMNFSVGESSLYLHKLLTKMNNYRKVEVVVAPTALALQPLSLQVDRHKIHLAAQNANANDFGAYTGEISFNQLRGLVKYAIIGHSERRHIFGETDRDVRAKVAAALRNGITPIICVGETALERENGETASVIKEQLHAALTDVAREELDRVILAYEPVWAISGHAGCKQAAPDDIAETISVIQKYLNRSFGVGTADQIPLLYGGSVRPESAEAYLSLSGISGLLVGGASLISSQFLAIIDIAKKVQNNGK